MNKRKCKLCGRETTETTTRRNRCNSCNTKIRRIRSKLAAIKLLGGECVDCGYKENSAAFEFHHLRDKSFGIGSAANKSWSVIKKELEKCILLCSNCHRIKHSTRNDETYVKEALNYKGPVEAFRMLE